MTPNERILALSRAASRLSSVAQGLGAMDKDAIIIHGVVDVLLELLQDMVKEETSK